MDLFLHLNYSLWIHHKELDCEYINKIKTQTYNNKKLARLKMYENKRQHKTQTQGSTKKGNRKSSIESQKGTNAAQWHVTLKTRRVLSLEKGLWPFWFSANEMLSSQAQA